MKRYKILGAIFLFVILILSACLDNSKKYNFYGESDNWSVTYNTEVTKEREFGEYIFKYIGKEPAPEVFVYKIENTALNIGIAEDTFNQKDNVHIGNVECTGCKVYTTENDKIKATLEWDGKTETIKLDSK